MNDDATKIKIFGSGSNRSARPIWTAKELGLEYQLIQIEELSTKPELRSLHPQSKIPSADIGGLEIFESSVICEYLCDSLPSNFLLAPSGTERRAEHSQWVSFAQSEVEAYLWHNFQLDRSDKGLKFFAETVELNKKIALAGLLVLDGHLESSEYLVGHDFGVTDIVVGWTVNWARRASLLESCVHLNRYLDRLFARPHCCLAR